MDKRFQEVWNRVTTTGMTDDKGKLQAFIQEERKDAAEYAALAGCTGSPQARCLFSRLSGEEREHARKLTAAAYMLNGDTCSAGGAKPEVKCGKTLQALRRRYEAEQRGAEAYETAAEAAHDRRLRSLYAALAEDERRHGDLLWDLMKRMM